MRILVTGSSGLLGSRLVDYLIKNTSHVIRIATRDNSDLWAESNRIEKKIIDWGSDQSIREICNGIDVVYHLAGVNSYACEESPKDAYSFNTIVTLSLYETAIKAKVKKFIFFSSSQVYGSNLLGVVTEETRLSPQNYYSASKAAAERALLLKKNQCTQLIIIRLSNSFGAPILKTAPCWDLFVNSLVKNALLFNELRINSENNLFRNFVPISDVLALCNSLLLNRDQSTNVINFGSYNVMSLLEMAELIKSTLFHDFGLSPRIVLKDKFELNNASGFFVYSMERLKNLKLDVNRIEPKFEIRNLITFCQQNY